VKKRLETADDEQHGKDKEWSPADWMPHELIDKQPD